MSQPDQPKRFVIIDGKSVFYRGYYAMPNLSTKDGVSTGGVYGFSVMALEVIKRLKPDYVAVAWDKPKTNIRKRLALYPEYKAGRKPAPPDFYEQVPILHEVLQAFGWPLYELDDYEADDIMGTLADQAAKKGIEALLVTSDLDALQLVGPLTKVYILKTGLSNIDLYSPASFEAKYEIEVSQFLDLKALKGDSSDNIPGVPGIGEKTATELLKQYKTLDGIYDNLALIKDSVSKKLSSGKELAYLSKKLGAIWLDAPIKLKLDEVDGSRCDPTKIQELFQKLEFRNLSRQLPEIMQLSAPALVTSSSLSTKPLKLAEARLIEKASDLSQLKELSSDEAIVIHCRSAGKHGQDPRYIYLSPTASEVYVLDVRKLGTKALKDILGSIHSLIGYDVKASLKVFAELGIKMPRVEHDVLVGAFVLNSLRREQTLTELAVSDLGYDGSSFEDLDDQQATIRAGETLAVIRGLYEKQTKELQKIPKFPNLVHIIEWPVIPVLAAMEYEGIALNTNYLKKFSVEIDDAISDLEQQIYGYADQEFNIASPAQLADVLFIKLHLPAVGIKKGKTGYSTAATELDKLRGQHPIVDLITQYREVVKLKNTYVDTLPLQVDENSRLHTTFNLTIAQTGRLSSTDPNLQNIPVRTDLGKHIRTAFVAGQGNSLISADYSQFELRLAAVLADDKELIALFNAGADIHTATAAQVYGREEEDVTKGMRRAAKVINFGILYGMSPHGLSVATGMTREQAVDFIDKYKNLRQPLFDYMEKLKEQARTDGYVETLFGRRRPMPDIQASNFVVRQAAERAAINMPIQGTEADLMKLAMVKANDKLSKQYPDSNILLQIHDSVLVESPTADAVKVGELLKQTMENVYKLAVQLRVDVSIGRNWGEL